VSAPRASLFQCRRDRFAQRLCNWILNHVATPWYRATVEWSIRKGLTAAERDEEVEILERIEEHIRQFVAPGGELIDWDFLEAALKCLDEARA
jgi:hypothetical protein